MSKIIFNGVDYAGGSGNYFNPVIYSDTERKIGVWRNNKPLYQKTVHINALPNSTQIGQYVDYPHGISDVDEIIDYEGIIHFSNGTSLKFVRLGFNASSFTPSASIDSYCNSTYIRIMCGSDRSSSNADYTILYTKTTDVAGSGDYNTLGVPTVHYSTNEQVVGTWVDGKPLYKKTYQFNSTVWLNANGWTNGINIDTTVVKVLVDAEVLRTIGAYSFYGYLQVVPYNNLLNIFNCRNTNMEIDTITLVYTKTTD